MTKTHERPESPTPDAGPSKKIKTIHSSLADGTDVTSAFANGVLDHANIANLHKTYLENKPFHYALVEKLFQDDLLSRVKEECITELSFTEKQTDIYKVCTFRKFLHPRSSPLITRRSTKPAIWPL